MVKARNPRRVKRKKEEESRPSLFFIIASIIGFAILVWWFFHFLPNRGAEEGEKKAAIVRPVESPELGARVEILDAQV
jgi:hypothetical protein